VISTPPRRVLWILALAVVAAAFFTAVRMKRDYVDFEVYQTAARRALSAEPLYRAADGHYQFKYLPAFALAMAPFAPIDPEVAKAIWFALSVALLIGFVRLSIALVPDRRRSVTWLGWMTALLIGKFVVKELVNGQSNILLGWVIVVAVAAAGRERRVAAGVLVGLAIFVKPYAILLLPWLLATQGFASVVAACGVVGAGLVLPAALYGAAMVCAWRRRARAPNYLECALLLWLIPILSPQGWDYVLIVGTPAIVLLLDRWRDLTPAWRGATVASLGVASFSIYDLVGRAWYFRLMDWSLITVAVLVLAVTLAHLRRRGLA
jgi:Glycosyltransferase family 87